MNDKFDSIFRKIMNLAPSSAIDSMSMDNLENWDSLRHAELLIAVQKEFRIKMKASDVLRLRSVSAIRDEIAKYREP